MYSLVLMTALTSAPDGPEFNGYFRDLFSGGSGCSGSTSAGGCSGYAAPRYSCYGGGGCSGSSSAAPYSPAGCTGSGYGCTGSAYSAGCNGCSGGGLFSGFGTRVRRLFDRGGCNGSGSGYGCSGSGYGCSGSGYGYGCSGSAYSCFGGPAVAYTPVFNGGLSCQGGLPMSAPAPVFDPYPSYPSYPARPGVAPPPATIPYAPPEAAPGPQAGVRPAGYGQSTLVGGNPSARATVLVRLPADARLYAEGRQLSLTGAERKFVSPELPGGQEFTYKFRVEYERDGETVSVTKKVAVRSGGTVAVEFTDLTAKAAPEKPAAGPVATTTSNSGGAAALVPSVAPTVPAVPAAPTPTVQPPPAAANPATDRATITVRLPAGATLYVDDRRSPSLDPVRQFSTPPIPVGREFAYLMRAEVVRNGQTETFTQKVPFRAGERVEVDFTGIGH